MGPSTPPATSSSRLLLAAPNTSLRSAWNSSASSPASTRCLSTRSTSRRLACSKRTPRTMTPSTRTTSLKTRRRAGATLTSLRAAAPAVSSPDLVSSQRMPAPALAAADAAVHWHSQAKIHHPPGHAPPERERARSRATSKKGGIASVRTRRRTVASGASSGARSGRGDLEKLAEEDGGAPAEEAYGTGAGGGETGPSSASPAPASGARGAIGGGARGVSAPVAAPASVRPTSRWVAPASAR